MKLLTRSDVSIDVNRCLHAMRSINVEGAPRPKRIEEAISLIQNDGGCLRKMYIGVKNYASFGDQNCDCKYGYGPSHGAIVFRIERVRDNHEACLGVDEIYLLECVRDFGAWADVAYSHSLRKDMPFTRNLCDTLRELQKAIARVEELETKLATASIKRDAQRKLERAVEE